MVLLLVRDGLAYIKNTPLPSTLDHNAAVLLHLPVEQRRQRQRSMQQ
jgi:hypothetical protein